MHPQTLNKGVGQAEIDGCVRLVTRTAKAEHIAKLQQENRELRGANHILKASAAFFMAELDRPDCK